MVDKNYNIITTEELCKRFWCFIKENTTQIAIAIPIITAIYASVSDYYFYIVSCGYYKYFRIDGNFMLSYNKNNLFQNIGQLVLGGLYWIFARFAVRIFLLKRNYLWKILSLIVVPLLINGWIAYDGVFSISLGIVSVIFLPVQWVLIFSLGYCMVGTFDREILGENQKINRKKKTKKHWRDKEYRLLGILLIFAGGIIIFWRGYSESNKTAVEKRRFGIIEIKEEQYAVIDANEGKLILQKCEINQDSLKIYCDTYLCADNDMFITFETFSNIELAND